MYCKFVLKYSLQVNKVTLKYLVQTSYICRFFSFHYVKCKCVFQTEAFTFYAQTQALMRYRFDDVETNEAYQRDTGPKRENNAISLCFSTQTRKVLQRERLNSKAEQISTAGTFKGMSSTGIMGHNKYH